MNEKRKHGARHPHGNLGRVFRFTQDDLAANRAGYMTLSQQFGFSFNERRLYSPLLKVPPFRWFVDNRRRRAAIITGKIKKHFHARLIQAASGGGGGGHADVLEQYRIAIDSGTGVETFYVREKQYNALPDSIEITLYFDPMEQRILSVEVPYDTA